MEVLVVRHAIAEDRAAFARAGMDDAARPLTDEGRRRFGRAARGLARLVPKIDLLATSPLARAIQTGEIVREAFGVERVVRLAELEPGADPAELLGWLRRQRPAPTIAVVGHEPHLSGFVGCALAGAPADFVELRKGSACLLDLGRVPRPGGARLRWLLTPRQLRRVR